ncbi:MAG: histidine--tRNA ligase [Crenarchaeota archaeon]|nr:histidine--tRNA ligase [Thermoproteota archaeon]MDW8033631.1 histidine--tRNA ligase [Nitrososphaerota archaeon]
MRDDLLTLRGMRNILPREKAKINKIESEIRRLFKVYGFKEVETPTIEPLELFELKSGEEIRHRMYRFTDLGGRNVVLRPEVTASVAKLVVQEMRSMPLPIKIGYILNVFRYDEPQHGRYREFKQGGFEIFGSKSPLADAEILEVSSRLMDSLGIGNYYVKIGHEGVLRAILTRFGVEENIQDRVLGLIDKEKLSEAFEILASLQKGVEVTELIKRLWEIKSRNPAEALRKAEAVVKDIPEAIEQLDNLREIIELAQASGVGEVIVDMGFARGLDYYTGMIFEVYVKDLRIAVGGGGRYDKLTGILGWDIPAVGCAPGIDRLSLVLNDDIVPKDDIICLIISMVKEGDLLASRLAGMMRARGIPTMVDPTRRDLNKALSYASKRGFKYVAIIGSKEVENKVVTLKDMEAGSQEELKPEQIVEKLSQYSI